VPVLISRQGVPAYPIGTPALRRRAERMLQALALPAAELSIVLCDDRVIHALNRDHRQHDKPTDVLAFALREGAPVPGTDDVLGDVVISLVTARRQAKQHKHDLWAEVTVLLAHGLLHLVGYDHRTDAEERRMNARADMLVAATSARRPQIPVRTVDKRGKTVNSRARKRARKRS
jgi:probable rRNA maturation factor